MSKIETNEGDGVLDLSEGIDVRASNTAYELVITQTITLPDDVLAGFSKLGYTNIQADVNAKGFNKEDSKTLIDALNLILEKATDIKKGSVPNIALGKLISKFANDEDYFKKWQKFIANLISSIRGEA